MLIDRVFAIVVGVLLGLGGLAAWYFYRISTLPGVNWDSDTKYVLILIINVTALMIVMGVMLTYTYARDRAYTYAPDRVGGIEREYLRELVLRKQEAPEKGRSEQKTLA
jgi:hypothetical protein